MVVAEEGDGVLGQIRSERCVEADGGEIEGYLTLMLISSWRWYDLGFSGWG